MTTHQLPGQRSPLGSGAVRQEHLREHNISLVLASVMHDERNPSRADIAAQTGLTRATVSSLVDRLIAGRLVTELSPGASPKAGRPAVPLVPSAGTVAALGVEVNVDYLAVRALDLAGNVIIDKLMPGDFRHSDYAVVLRELAGLTTKVLASLQRRGIPVVGACLALPGLVDLETGPLRHAPNLGWRDLDVVAYLRKRGRMSRLKLLVANEANVAALAEANALRGQHIDSFVYISGEVGIGAAMVLGGRVRSGAHGWGGEIGHVVIEPSGPRCTCGSTGCLERYAGKDALMAAAGLDSKASVEALLLAAQGGEPLAVSSVAAGGRALGLALANFVNLVDIETIVLGGIYASLAPVLTPYVEAELATRVMSAPWASPTVRVAMLGQHAAVTGGALTVIESLVADPEAWMSGALELTSS
ncbi:ROK family transcriptional regulator [Nakamurella antarctica]|uniref:ROK family transcriptional regulator n=1 Tax=Nakamurella antarctica TaxID=1902245 RepID=A0A3G8ZQQ4_9ACTN|nr:ROK family transcriptional regulator [Nakamurella antarctica]AZI59135.1 ROK family transcriptional regulator [Nakamurella antarctica]